MWIVKDEELGHPFVSDLASESDDEFDAGSDEVCHWERLFIIFGNLSWIGIHVVASVPTVECVSDFIHHASHIALCFCTVSLAGLFLERQ